MTDLDFSRGLQRGMQIQARREEIKMTTHSQVRDDYNRLDEINECGDTIMFAADHVFDLMANPTKKKAKEMYESGISCWFMQHSSIDFELDRFEIEDIEAIAKRYGEEFTYCE